MKDEHAGRIAHVHSVHRESMGMDIQTEGRVAALDEGHCAGERVFHAMQAEMFLRTTTQRT